MKKKEKLSIFEVPDAARFFAWIALSAAIFFGAYSVKVKDKYNKAVDDKITSAQEERELKYQLELAGIKIKESTTTIAWANNEISRLREKNDRIQQKVSNIRKLFYSAVKKNKEEELAVVVPKITDNKSDLKEVEDSVVDDDFGNEVLFPEISRQVAMSDKKIEELVNKSTDLRKKAEFSAKVLTYNPASKKVFINLGSSNGEIAEGNRFVVWRDGKHVTDIRVNEVYSVTSICEIVGPVLSGLKAGDIAEKVVSKQF